MLFRSVDFCAADAAHLYLWTTDTHIRLALNCVEAWGFEYKKILVWVKRRASTAPIVGAEGEALILRGPIQIGMGHYFRGAKEICLFATRGKAPGLAKNLPDVLEHPRGQHSRKPDQILEWAERMSAGPRIELFARRSREGWAAWGDQFPGHDVYLRSIAKANELRRSLRVVGLAKAKDRVARILRYLPDMVEGISKWPARCPFCLDQISAGDLIRYLPDDSLKICGGCAQDADQELAAGVNADLPF